MVIDGPTYIQLVAVLPQHCKTEHRMSNNQEAEDKKKKKTLPSADCNTDRKSSLLSKAHQHAVATLTTGHNLDMLTLVKY